MNDNWCRLPCHVAKMIWVLTKQTAVNEGKQHITACAGWRQVCRLSNAAGVVEGRARKAKAELRQHWSRPTTVQVEFLGCFRSKTHPFQKVIQHLDVISADAKVTRIMSLTHFLG